MEDNFITPIQPIQPMGFTPIEPIQPIVVGGNAQETTKVKGQEGISTFKGIFEEAIGNVRTTEDTLAKEQYRLATGQVEDPHTVMIASSQAQLASDMLVALRSHALQSYNEIMRISS